MSSSNVRRALLFLLLLAPQLAEAKALVADLSAYRIPINSDFRGTRLFLFGARGAPGQVVVAVRGPERNYLVRRKARFLGMWMVREQKRFVAVPQFYAMYATAPLDLVTTPELRKSLGLGLPNLSLKAEWPEAEHLDEFRAALTKSQTERLLYTEQGTPVRFMGDTLFKAEIAFPDSIQPGEYVTDIYLVDGTGLVASQSVPIQVRKRGFEAFLSRAARQHPLLYGLVAVGIALLSGWGAHRIFRRFGLI